MAELKNGEILSPNNLTNKDLTQFIKKSYNVASVAKGTQYWTKYLLSRVVNGLFYYEPLNDQTAETFKSTLPPHQIELQQIIKGYCVITDIRGKIYAPVVGSKFGYNEYYENNKYTYSNVKLGSKNGLENGKDCVIIYNTEIDKVFDGSIVFETIQRYARMLADLESTFVNSLVYARGGLIAQAQNQTAANTMNELINKLKNGDVSSVVNATQLIESIKLFDIQPTLTYNTYTETRDYLINCFLNLFGLQTLEEKKERMITDEIDVDEDVLKQNVNTLYACRLAGADECYKLFGERLHYTVKLSNNIA